jgi:hypothetical protein
MRFFSNDYFDQFLLFSMKVLFLLGDAGNFKIFLGFSTEFSFSISLNPAPPTHKFPRLFLVRFHEKKIPHLPHTFLSVFQLFKINYFIFFLFSLSFFFISELKKKSASIHSIFFGIFFFFYFYHFFYI